MYTNCSLPYMAPVNELLAVLLRSAQASLGIEDVVMSDNTLWIFHPHWYPVAARSFSASEMAVMGRKKSRDRTLLLLTQELETQTQLWETPGSHSCLCLSKLIIKFNPLALTGTPFSWKLHLQSTDSFGLTSQRGKSNFSSIWEQGFCSVCKVVTDN